MPRRGRTSIVSCLFELTRRFQLAGIFFDNATLMAARSLNYGIKQGGKRMAQKSIV